VNGRESNLVTISWGITTVSQYGIFRDAMLYPGGACEWDWRKSDTHHVPGIQPTDVIELVDRGCEVLILSRGMQLVLQTDSRCIDFLKSHSIEHFIEESTMAVQIYNRLVYEGKRVGALIHSTC
jgi:hypothetical protein